ncbi:MAG: hypothetical protein N4J56_007132 [Chroococcidiopsis sp. SAG 2025]|uniref:hypothetical protein n=1 Tax=Chroococcidiopsis sp. SAG 2025 TaxID=171389 RepID=UPI0029370C44|nr:hypothetical protein [Chroococcidiopsis sp. SAG 2025]MDV2997427.1 hypothetical protein [Chroococcidiopsis sp. SAG 2025]
MIQVFLTFTIGLIGVLYITLLMLELLIDVLPPHLPACNSVNSHRQVVDRMRKLVDMELPSTKLLIQSQVPLLLASVD